MQSPTLPIEQGEHAAHAEPATSGIVVESLVEMFHLAAETAPFLFVGFLVAGILKVVVPPRWISGQLGGEGLGAITRAGLLGVPLPLCSCSVIPTAKGLRDAGAGRGPTTAFLISTPETGVDSISVTYALLDPLMTVIRPVVSFVTAVVTGVLVALFGGEEAPEGVLDELDTDDCCPSASPVVPDDAAASGCKSAAPGPGGAEGVAASTVGVAPGTGDAEAGGCCPEPSPNKLKAVLHYGFVTLVDDLAAWLLIGFALSGVVAAAVPASFFTDTVPDGLVGMLLMIAVGTPLYICATASTPIAATLVAKGLSPGAALVFLLVGPATNATTLLVVTKLIGKRAVAIYLGGIVLVALAAGYATNALYQALDLDLRTLVAEAMAHEPSTFAQVAGAALLLLLVVRLVLSKIGPTAHDH